MASKQVSMEQFQSTDGAPNISFFGANSVFDNQNFTGGLNQVHIFKARFKQRADAIIFIQKHGLFGSLVLLHLFEIVK